jgi:N-acetylglucosamine kinase-like BadF-type ATPase
VAIYLAGVDIGTSGAKGMVFDLQGNPLASTYPKPAWVEQDADLVVEAAMDAMARAVSSSGVKRLLSTQNCEQHFAQTANLMSSARIKTSRIHLTSSPGYGRLRHRSLLFRTRLNIFLYPGGAGHEGIRFPRTY